MHKPMIPNAPLQAQFVCPTRRGLRSTPHFDEQHQYDPGARMSRRERKKRALGHVRPDSVRALGFTHSRTSKFPGEPSTSISTVRQPNVSWQVDTWPRYRQAQLRTRTWEHCAAPPTCHGKRYPVVRQTADTTDGTDDPVSGTRPWCVCVSVCAPPHLSHIHCHGASQLRARWGVPLTSRSSRRRCAGVVASHPSRCGL